MLDPGFVQLLNKLLIEISSDTNDGITFNFRDPTYSPETGGFHPVEISVNSKGILQYVTDFAYFGSPPMAELEKELDFDFSMNVFQQFGQNYDLIDGQGLFRLYTQNFCAYHEMGVYEVSVTSL
ncbi:MAG: DUF2787 domain-containing protein [Bacteroidetes bacterium]|nr:DUF2787 domain-containing protein [Bacteroidota bacterium]